MLAWGYGDEGRQLKNKYEYFSQTISDDIYDVIFIYNRFFDDGYSHSAKILSIMLLKLFNKKAITLEDNSKNGVDKYSIKFCDSNVIADKEELVLYNTLLSISDNHILSYDKFRKIVRKSSPLNKYDKPYLNEICSIFNRVDEREKNKGVAQNKIKNYTQSFLILLKKEIYELNSEYKEKAEQLLGFKKYIQNYKTYKDQCPISNSNCLMFLYYSIILGISQSYLKILETENIIDNDLIEKIEFIINFSYNTSIKPMDHNY